MWTEEDRPNPILTYGKQKVAVENYLIEKSSQWVIARFSKVVSLEADAHDLFGEWLKDIDAGKVLKCARDQIFSPAGVEEAVNALIRLAESHFTGIFHVCGPRPVTRLELLNTLVEEIGKYREVQARIVSCSIRDRDLGFAEPRPFDTSMSPRKLYATLGHGFNDPREVCRKVAKARYRQGCVTQETGHVNAQ